MFRRTFWFTTGVAAGVWATTKVNRKLNQLTPESLAAQAADRAVLAGRRIKVFALDVRDGMADREAALKDALGLSAPPPDDRKRLPAQRGRSELTRTTPYKLHKAGNEDH
ncbi:MULTISPECIES: DUF6167 family protein [Streptomyces violaceusniger group]|uniref:Secreted protein n=3 Tax=Streptomyces violaceusniger group TaxID=2839105 RepID=A0A0A0N9T4_STRRN|nr:MULTISPECIES: DUF6167 family protein [Streptomyces violaceusniger group]AGP53669.1 hypothetical protein M271_10290 [Streptomyces rapamycinicus NRRL 5491]MBB4781149.1 hypothetical protein [Streptomyces rapamycinicus]MBP2066520.1 hypothetical protein [Streptomyces iranensis]RLV74206.1 hypothetical protein D3C57_133310 [Streptomyces rapamycinicus NRRL 5491]UTO61799.1 DUF6167 family protein [Streptomyces rapamycinicus]